MLEAKESNKNTESNFSFRKKKKNLIVKILKMGAVETVAVVKAADDGVVAPIVVLLIVLDVMFKPDCAGFTEA